MKKKTKDIRNSRFPLHDAKSVVCSEKGFSLLQWDFTGRALFKGNLPKYSHQLPTDVVNQILKWRDLEILDRELR